MNVLRYRSQVLVIGSGLAGCAAALTMADRGFEVHLLMPTEELDGGNSIMAQGGIVFSTDGEDQKSLQHDMFVAGHNYNYVEAVRFLAEHGGEAVQSMLIDKLHVPFDCNASGALVAIIAIVSGTAEAMEAPQYLAIALACAGVIGLGFVEANEDDDLRAARQEASNYKYAKSWLALALPIAYCMLDAAGTFADDLVLETLNEDSANVAYELTFLAAGIVCFVYTVIVKKQPLVPKMEVPKYVGAMFETAGQFAYIYALASGESALAAPIISSYCMASVLWSRLFLKEKLSWKHYACICVTFAGILIMGIYDM